MYQSDTRKAHNKQTVLDLHHKRYKRKTHIEDDSKP